MRRRQGFTLIELLVVIAIISLLVSILLPSLNHARELTKRAICVANLHHIAAGLQMYVTQDIRGHFPPSPMWENAGGSMKLFAHNNPQKDDPSLDADFGIPRAGRVGYNDPWLAMGLLFDAGISDDPQPFYCPGIEEGKYLHYPEGWDNWKNPAYEGFRWGGYLYRMFGQPYPTATPAITVKDVVDLWHTEASADEAMAADVLLNVSQRGDPAHLEPIYGTNVAFGDGHAEFVDLGPGELSRADKVPLTYYKRDLFTYLYFKYLGNKDTEPLDDAGFPQ